VKQANNQISAATGCREPRLYYFQESLRVSRTCTRSLIKPLAMLIWGRVDFILSGDADSFGRTVPQIFPQASW